MSRRSQLAISSWFNEWFLSTRGQADKLATVSAISSQVVLYSRLALYKQGEKQPDGLYQIDEGVTVVIPMTEENLGNLPASLAAWMIDAAAKENQFILSNFLAGARTAMSRGEKMSERLSASGLSGKTMHP